MVLSDLQYEILEYISNHSYPSGDEIAAAFSLDSYSSESTLRFLCENGLIFFTTANSLTDFIKSCDTEKRMDLSWFSMKYHFYLTESGKAFSDESVKNSKRPSICTLIATAVALLTLLLDLIVKRTDILSFFRSLH